jgi:PAS domain S-box-containing protein
MLDEEWSEQDYRGMIEHSLQGIIIVQDDRILFTNPAGAEITGYSQEQLVEFYPVKISAVIFDDDRESVENNFSWCLAMRKPIRQESRIWRRDGVVRWIELLAGRVMYHGKASIQLACVDITRRKEIEEALRFMQFSIDRNADAVFWIGSDARFSYVNEAACRSLGYSHEELKNLRVFDIDPDFSEASWEAHWKDVRGRQSFVMESYHRSKDGRIFPVEISNNFVMFEGVEHNCVFARNISERRKAEVALRASEDRFRIMFNGTSDGMALIEMETRRFHYVNRAVCDLLGYPEAELLTMSVDNIHPKDQLSHVFEQHRKLALMEIGMAPNIPVRRKDGTILFVDIFAPRIELDNKIYLLNVFRDITERKQAEIALRESEAKFRSIVQASPLGICLFRLEENGLLVFIEGNSAADALFGFDHRKLPGVAFEKIFRPLADGDLIRKLNEVAANGKSWQIPRLEYRQEDVQRFFEVLAFQIAPGEICVMFKPEP